MPIKATYIDASLVQATPHLKRAAEAEGLTAEETTALWVDLTEALRNGLVAYAQDPVSNGATLDVWRHAFPKVFAKLSSDKTDEQASAIIRTAVAMAGGVVE